MSDFFKDLSGGFKDLEKQIKNFEKGLKKKSIDKLLSIQSEFLRLTEDAIALHIKGGISKENLDKILKHNYGCLTEISQELENLRKSTK